MFLLPLILITLLKLPTLCSSARLWATAFSYLSFTFYVADDIFNADSGSSPAYVPKPNIYPFCMSNVKSISNFRIKQFYQIRYLFLVSLDWIFKGNANISTWKAQFEIFIFHKCKYLIRCDAKIKSFYWYKLIVQLRKNVAQGWVFCL